MIRWRRYKDIWCLWPAKPIGLIELIGGSYLATNPQIAYKRLLESLCQKDIAVHAWGYFPNFDHQAQANQAWKDFRECRKHLESRVSTLPISLRIGHSLGCKLHLLSPDGGRNSRALIAISFNNFNANKSIPMLKKVSSRLGFSTEFSPSPQKTLNLISKHYLQPKNLLITFEGDNLDQTPTLLKCLKDRAHDSTSMINLKGGHLTPASAGVRESIFGKSIHSSTKDQAIKQLIKLISNLSCS